MRVWSFCVHRAVSLSLCLFVTRHVVSLPTFAASEQMDTVFAGLTKTFEQLSPEHFAPLSRTLLSRLVFHDERLIHRTVEDQYRPKWADNFDLRSFAPLRTSKDFADLFEAGKTIERDRRGAVLNYAFSAIVNGPFEETIQKAIKTIWFAAFHGNADAEGEEKLAHAILTDIYVGIKLFTSELAKIERTLELFYATPVPLHETGAFISEINVLFRNHLQHDIRRLTLDRMFIQQMWSNVLTLINAVEGTDLHPFFKVSTAEEKQEQSRLFSQHFPLSPVVPNDISPGHELLLRIAGTVHAMSGIAMSDVSEYQWEIIRHFVDLQIAQRHLLVQRLFALPFHSALLHHFPLSMQLSGAHMWSLLHVRVQNFYQQKLNSILGRYAVKGRSFVWATDETFSAELESMLEPWQREHEEVVATFHELHPEEPPISPFDAINYLPSDFYADMDRNEAVAAYFAVHHPYTVPEFGDDVLCVLVTLDLLLQRDALRPKLLNMLTPLGIRVRDDAFFKEVDVVERFKKIAEVEWAFYEKYLEYEMQFNTHRERGGLKALYRQMWKATMDAFGDFDPSEKISAKAIDGVYETFRKAAAAEPLHLSSTVQIEDPYLLRRHARQGFLHRDDAFASALSTTMQALPLPDVVAPQGNAEQDKLLSYLQVKMQLAPPNKRPTCSALGRAIVTSEIAFDAAKSMAQGTSYAPMFATAHKSTDPLVIPQTPLFTSIKALWGRIYHVELPVITWDFVLEHSRRLTDRDLHRTFAIILEETKASLDLSVSTEVLATVSLQLRFVFVYLNLLEAMQTVVLPPETPDVLPDPAEEIEGLVLDVTSTMLYDETYYWLFRQMYKAGAFWHSHFEAVAKSLVLSQTPKKGMPVPLDPLVTPELFRMIEQYYLDALEGSPRTVWTEPIPLSAIFDEASPLLHLKEGPLIAHLVFARVESMRFQIQHQVALPLERVLVTYFPMCMELIDFGHRFIEKARVHNVMLRFLTQELALAPYRFLVVEEEAYYTAAKDISPLDTSSRQREVMWIGVSSVQALSTSFLHLLSEIADGDPWRTVETYRFLTHMSPLMTFTNYDVNMLVKEAIASAISAKWLDALCLLELVPLHSTVSDLLDLTYEEVMAGIWPSSVKAFIGTSQMPAMEVVLAGLRPLHQVERIDANIFYKGGPRGIKAVELLRVQQLLRARLKTQAHLDALRHVLDEPKKKKKKNKKSKKKATEEAHQEERVTPEKQEEGKREQAQQESDEEARKQREEEAQRQKDCEEAEQRSNEAAARKEEQQKADAIKRAQKKVQREEDEKRAKAAKKAAQRAKKRQHGEHAHVSLPAQDDAPPKSTFVDTLASYRQRIRPRLYSMLNAPAQPLISPPPSPAASLFEQELEDKFPFPVLDEEETHEEEFGQTQEEEEGQQAPYVPDVAYPVPPVFDQTPMWSPFTIHYDQYGYPLPFNPPMMPLYPPYDPSMMPLYPPYDPSMMPLYPPYDPSMMSPYPPYDREGR